MSASPPAAGDRVLMVGCGHMGGAMLRRWLAEGRDPAGVTVVSPSGRPMPAGVAVVAAIADAGAGFDTVVLALKPQQLDAVTPAAIAGTGARRLVSILGGVPVAKLTPLFPDGAVVRAMPNLPVAIGEGVVALYAGVLGDADGAAVAALMAPLGLVRWIDDEAAFGAVTALAGCGPGFVFRFVAALTAAGTVLGLDPMLADRLARATVAGAGAMARDAQESPDTLADRVASPGGSTRAGLNVLDRDDALRTLMAETLAASWRRDAEMANRG